METLDPVETGGYLPLIDDHVFSFRWLETSSAREVFGDCLVVSVSGFGMGGFIFL